MSKGQCDWRKHIEIADEATVCPKRQVAHIGRDAVTLTGSNDSERKKLGPSILMYTISVSLNI